MLVLSRKPGEWIELSNGVKILLSEVRGDKARIGIVAPADVKIYRQEVAARIGPNADVAKAVEPAPTADVANGNAAHAAVA